jgi:hypothetical protein
MINLKDFASTNGVKDHFIKASFGGFAGSGKSRTASELIVGIYKDLKIDKPLLFIDNEKGGRFLVPQFQKAGIEVLWKQTTKLADIIMAFEYLNKGEIGLLFVDSLSKVWYDYVADYKKKNGNKTFMTLQDWGKILPAWQAEFSDRFVDLNGSCVFTGRGGYTYDMEEDENGKKAFAKSGVKMKMAGETPFEPDINIWMDIDQEMKDGKPIITRTALIMKDRSGLIDGKTFINPTYNDFKPVVSYLVGLTTGKVAGVTNENNIAPVENREWQRENESKEIQIEKLSQTFAKYGYSGSTSKEAKRIGILAMEKCFDTNSTKEAERKYNSFQLQKRTEALDHLLNELKDITEGQEAHITEFDLDSFLSGDAQMKNELHLN